MAKKEKNVHLTIEPNNIQSIDLRDVFAKHSQANALTIEIQRYASAKIYDIIDIPGKDKMEITCIISGHAQLHFFISAIETKKNQYTFILQGKRAKAAIHGFYLLSDSQKLNVHITQKHMVQHTESNVILHGVIAGNAQCDFTGTVFVAKKGKKAVVSQENKTLIFEDAQICSRPYMEVLNNNDVTCKHASAVGNIDETNLFYLQSRGLMQLQAKKIMVEGFFMFWLKALDNDVIKKNIVMGIQDKIGRIL